MMPTPDILPHRFPVRLVDRITVFDPGRSLTAVKAVTANEPCYRDLANTAPYPSVLVIESWCQAALVLVLEGREAEPDSVPVLGSMSDVEVLGPVWPGDVLTHEVHLTRSWVGTWIIEGTAHVAGTPVLSVGQAVVAVRDRTVLEDA